MLTMFRKKAKTGEKSLGDSLIFRENTREKVRNLQQTCSFPSDAIQTRALTAVSIFGQNAPK